MPAGGRGGGGSRQAELSQAALPGWVRDAAGECTPLPGPPADAPLASRAKPALHCLQAPSAWVWVVLQPAGAEAQVPSMRAYPSLSLHSTLRWGQQREGSGGHAGAARVGCVGAAAPGPARLARVRRAHAGRGSAPGAVWAAAVLGVAGAHVGVAPPAGSCGCEGGSGPRCMRGWPAQAQPTGRPRSWLGVAGVWWRWPRRWPGSVRQPGSAPPPREPRAHWQVPLGAM